MLPSDTGTETLSFGNGSWAGTFKTSSIGQLQLVLKGHILFESIFTMAIRKYIC